MSFNTIRSYYYYRGGQGYSAEYQAVLDARGTAPSQETQAKQNTLMTGLKLSGIFNLLDIFCVMADDADIEFSTTNWINPATFQSTNFGATKTANQGILGNGSTTYWEIGLSPSNGVQYQLNDAEWGFWLFANPEGEQVAGTTDGSNVILLGSSTVQRINSTNSAAAAFSFAGTGFKAIERTTSTNISFYNNTTTANSTSTSTGRTTDKFTLGRRGATYNASIYAAFWAGKSLGTKNTDLYNLLNTYLTSL